MGFVQREASAVITDLVGGLEGFGGTLNFSIE
jgi:hypothetical protein